MANKITEGETATQNQLVIFSDSLSIDTARIETYSITLPLSSDKFYNPGKHKQEQYFFAIRTSKIYFSALTSQSWGP